jgi:hypothetical protein
MGARRVAIRIKREAGCKTNRHYADASELDHKLSQLRGVLAAEALRIVFGLYEQPEIVSTWRFSGCLAALYVENERFRQCKLRLRLRQPPIEKLLPARPRNYVQTAEQKREERMAVLPRETARGKTKFQNPLRQDLRKGT